MNSYRSFAGGPFGSNLKSCDYTENGIPVIQLNNITETYLDFSQRIIFTSTKKADELKACNAFPNELIIAKMMPAGRACISSTLYSRYVLGSDAIRVSPDLSLTNIFFIRAQINSNRIKAYIKERTTGSTRQRIGIPELKKLPMFMPTKIEQDKIGNFVELLESRIATQNKIIESYESLIKSLRDRILYKNNWKWTKLKALVDGGSIELRRGDIIPKHVYDSRFIFPVYSSSIHNNGLMGFNDSYMFDEELITWSIDGGGDFFIRNKHKFNVTNVCGILKIIDDSFDYSFLYEMLSYQHSRMTFDYQTKAHPSAIQTIYSVPLIELKEQKKIGSIFRPLYEKIKVEKDILEHYKLQKKYLLKNLFI